MDDIRIGRSLVNESNIKDCAKNLESEWKELEEIAQRWQNDVINANERIVQFDVDMQSISKRLSEAESTHAQWNDKTSVPKAAWSDQDHFNQLTTEIKQMEEKLVSLKSQSDKIPSLSSTSRIQLTKLESKINTFKNDVQNQDQKSKKTQSTSVNKKAHVKYGPPPRKGLNSTEASNMTDEIIKTENESCLFSTVLPCGWERSLTPEQIPYFLNHDDEKTHWDHPSYTELMNSLLEMNTVKYSAYRLALKLRKVQQKLCLDLLDLEAALCGFDEHGLKFEKHDLSIRVPEMVLILTSIYETLQQEEPMEVSVPLCVDLCLNWLLNIYDPGRTGQIRVFSFKLGIMLLCRGPLTEKYLHMFKLIANQSSKMATAKQLGLLLFDSLQIPKVLGEIASFGGSNVEPSVRSCMTLDSNDEKIKIPTEIDAKHFLKWLKQEPQCLVWLPVLHRLSSAETAKHNAKCKVCKMYPIVGFRYHCQKCFNYDLCHNCFFLGKVSKGHKSDHPTQEYCTSTGHAANLKIWGQGMRNSFRTKNYFKKKQNKLGYLPVNCVQEGEKFDLGIPNNTANADEKLNDKPEIIKTETSTIKSDHKQDDEHLLIAMYCRKLEKQNNLSIDEDNDENEEDNVSVNGNNIESNGNKKDELETMIDNLQKEHDQLNDEYKSLLRKQTNVNHQNGDVETETKQLKHQAEKMEARMKILDDHNKQLEAQLTRLKTLLAANQDTSDDEDDDDVVDIDPSFVGRGIENSKYFGTLESKAVIAAKLHSKETQTKEGT